MDYLRAFSVKLLPATDTRPSRIAIKNLHNDSKSIKISAVGDLWFPVHDSGKGPTIDRAMSYLNHKGFRVTHYSKVGSEGFLLMSPDNNKW